jgi:polyhydroxyalkanoate synthesis regulator phasin
MAEEQKGGARRGAPGIGDGIRTGLGILNAFREAIEETLQEASERGDFSPDRAKRAVHEATQRMQEGLEEARERLDFVPRKDFEALQAEVAELRRRIETLETPPAGPDASGIIIEPG